jgi:hypothetical protein
MTGIDDQDLTEFLDTIKNLSLPEPQRKLLNAVLKVASDIQDETEEVTERAFTEEIIEAFTKKKADLVLRYASSRPPVTIIRKPPGAITNSATRPAAIIKTPPPDPTPDPDDEH